MAHQQGLYSNFTHGGYNIPVGNHHYNHYYQQQQQHYHNRFMTWTIQDWQNHIDRWNDYYQQLTDNNHNLYPSEQLFRKIKYGRLNPYSLSLKSLENLVYWYSNSSQTLSEYIIKMIDSAYYYKRSLEGLDKMKTWELKGWYKILEENRQRIQTEFDRRKNVYLSY